MSFSFIHNMSKIPNKLFVLGRKESISLSDGRSIEGSGDVRLV